MNILFLAQADANHSVDDFFSFIISLAGIILAIYVLIWIRTIAKSAKEQTDILKKHTDILMRIAFYLEKATKPNSQLHSGVTLEDQEKMREEAQNLIGKKMAARHGPKV